MLWKFLNFYRRFLPLRNHLLFKTTAKFLQTDFGLQFVLYCVCLSFLLTSLQSQLDGRKKTTSDNDWQRIPLHEGRSMWAHKCIAATLRCFPRANSCDKKKKKTLARAHNPQQEESVKQDVFPPWRLRDTTFKYAAENMWNWHMSAQEGRAEIGGGFFLLF